MGIVKKQAYKNTLVSYTGMVVAYINTILLFPFFVTNEQYGLYNLLISLSVLYSLFASLGIPSIISKYFPFYKSEDRVHHGFIIWAAIFSLVGFIGSTIIFVLLRPIILSAYIGTSPLFIKYYYYLIPLALFTISFNFLEVTGRVIYQSIFSSFLRDVVIRLLTTVLLILMAIKLINFEEFIIWYIISWGIISSMLLASLAYSRKFSFRVYDLSFKAIEKKEIVSYGMFTLVSVAVYVLLQKVDVVMLSSMVGDSVQGVYSWYFNIALVISVPAAALSRTTYQIVADAWKSNDMKNIADVYNKTSIIQMVIGCLILIGIIINKENLLAIVHDKDKTAQFSLVIIIGFGFLVDITGGLNTYIITTSHKYRLITVFVILSSLICIGLNYVLIPLYKGMGAAIAYLVTMIILNFCTWLYIKYRFKMQPFTIKHFMVIVTSLISFLVGHYFWRMQNLYVDIAIRSGITSILYILLSYRFQVSVDLNEKIDKSIRGFKTIFS